MNKYTIIAIVWIASLIATAYFVWDYTEAKAAEDKLSAVNRAIAQQREINKENRELELAAAQQDRKVEIVYRDRIKKVTEYVERSDRIECFDSDGLQLFNAISAGVGDASGY